MLDPAIAERLMDSATFVPRDYASLPQGSLLKCYAGVLGLLDGLGDVEKKLNELRGMMKEEFIRRASVEGVEKFSGEGISVTVKDKQVVKYDPEKWDEILKGLVESGHGFCLHRRLSEGKVQELMDNGVRLPDGLSLEPIKEVSHRRV